MTYRVCPEQCDDSRLVLKQDIEFEVENVSDTDFEWDMTFQYGGGPLITYNPLYMGIKLDSEHNPFDEISLKDDFVEDPVTIDKLEYKTKRLAKPIVIKPGEKVTIKQIVLVTYSLSHNGGMMDYYFCTIHTKNLSITFDLGSDDYDHKLFPTFGVDSMPAPDRMLHETRYDNIKYLIPGQGYSFTIFKKGAQKVDIDDTVFEEILHDQNGGGLATAEILTDAKTTTYKKKED